jgi:arylsulfatase A
VLTKPEDYGPAMFTDFLIDFIRRHRDGPFIAYATMCQTHAPHDPTPDLARPGARTEGGLANNLEYLDHLVGRLVRALDELDLRRRTLVIFTGDNGTGGDGKGTTTELGVRVPLIVSCPGTVPAGVVSGELASLTDIFPTLADFAGAAAPAGHTIDGKSLANVLRGGKAGPREWLFSYLKNERMLRDKRWLLQGDGRLFDCGSSRDGAGYREVTDLADTEAAAARRRLEALLRDLPPPRPEEQELRLEGRQAAE